MATANLGTVSHGTLRSEDLIEAFCETLTELIDARSLEPGAEAFKDDYARLTDLMGAAERETDPEQMDEYVVELMGELEAFAPEYAYFGSHEGDGSDFGFWLSWERIEEDRRFGDLPSGDQLPDGPPEGLFLVVSDHGNATLYGAAPNGDRGTRWVELWSVV